MTKFDEGQLYVSQLRSGRHPVPEKVAVAAEAAYGRAHASGAKAREACKAAKRAARDARGPPPVQAQTFPVSVSLLPAEKARSVVLTPWLASERDEERRREPPAHQGDVREGHQATGRQD